MVLRWIERVIADPSDKATGKARSDGVQDLPEQDDRRLIREIIGQMKSKACMGIATYRYKGRTTFIPTV